MDPVMEMDEKISQIQRIEDMEASLNRAQTAVAEMERALENYKTAKEDIRRLDAYLNSEERRRDLAAEEAGSLPPDLRRGVLSEDGIWNLLERSSELLRELEHISAICGDQQQTR